ncbi:glycosyltransferase family 2 protein, partial [bacterium]|nr:glycosyltransferase family 2 protein [bacterium]
KGAEIPVHQPFYREFGGKALNRIIQILAIPGIRDTQCGFKLFTGDAAREIFSMCFLNGWGFDIEVLYLARRMGYSVAEVPVKWSHVEGSKIHPFQAALRVIADIISMRCHHYPKT